MKRPSAATARPEAPASVDLYATVTCSHCGLAAVWGELARVKVLEGAALESHLAVHAEDWYVDVRACARCGRSFARKVRDRQGHDGPVETSIRQT
jgi:hypothetical protein